MRHHLSSLSNFLGLSSLQETLGLDISTLKEMGHSTEDILKAGFDAYKLKEAEYTPTQLKEAEYTDQDILKAGFNATQLKDAGYTAEVLKRAGYTARQLQPAMYPVKQLRHAGYAAEQLKDVGYSAIQLKDGYTLEQLQLAGYTIKELLDSEYNACKLHKAGYHARDLKDAGYNLSKLKNAGYRATQLKAAGFNATQLKNAEVPDKDILRAGFNATQLKDDGFTLEQLNLIAVSVSEPSGQTIECYVPKQLSIKEIRGHVAQQLNQAYSIFQPGNEEALNDDLLLSNLFDHTSLTFFAIPTEAPGNAEEEYSIFTQEEVNETFQPSEEKAPWTRQTMIDKGLVNQKVRSNHIQTMTGTRSAGERAYLLYILNESSNRTTQQQESQDLDAAATLRY